MSNKSIKFSLIAQGVSKETYEKLVEVSYKSVALGVSKANKNINSNPLKFSYRGLKSLWYSASIKSEFHKSVLLDSYLRTKVKHLKSHGVDYYLVEGKALLCFKRMDSKSKISGFYSKRFKELMSGNPIHYSKNMLDMLSMLGVQKPLPIYFVGHILDLNGNIKDVKLVHYHDNKIVFDISLKMLNTVTLFRENGSDDILVTPKRLRKAN
ncbi:hypothetical protein ABHQ57_03890 [Tenacibaculum sp. ZH5_bin.1]|uniref:hypothetical protein n=1 Tax=Tenacibaculum TaxID=104267 RepID=UPI001431B824|nr:hypothetical protein [Tenacibaculum mesophilum]KAF9659591.1 hypothetical protein HBA12_04935 [Tenacibaculum mesophilum]